MAKSIKAKREMNFNVDLLENKQKKLNDITNIKNQQIQMENDIINFHP